jgi:hypothetical protein
MIKILTQKLLFTDVNIKFESIFTTETLIYFSNRVSLTTIHITSSGHQMC